MWYEGGGTLQSRWKPQCQDENNSHRARLLPRELRAEAVKTRPFVALKADMRFLSLLKWCMMLLHYPGIIERFFSSCIGGRRYL